MNKVLMTLLFSAFILTGTCYAQAPAAAPADAPAVAAPEKEKPAKHHEREHAPELHKALHKLKAAKQDLEKAAHDYDGHKAKAIEAVDHAISEIQEALDVEKK